MVKGALAGLGIGLRRVRVPAVIRNRNKKDPKRFSSGDVVKSTRSTNFSLNFDIFFAKYFNARKHQNLPNLSFYINFLLTNTSVYG